MGLSSQFQVCLFYFIFFDEKISRAQKASKHLQAKISQQNKNKLTLNSKDNNFSRTHKLLGVMCVFARVKSFRKKKR